MALYTNCFLGVEFVESRSQKLARTASCLVLSVMLPAGACG